MKRNVSQSGKSIVELVIVLLVLAIIVVFALTSFKNSKTSFNRQNLARELKVSLERARYDSMKRHATTDDGMARVTIESATSFSVATDLNEDQVIEDFEVKKTDLSGSGITIVGDNLGLPVTIKFDRRGFITATNRVGAPVKPNFTICENCTLATAAAGNSDIIWISSTGTVVMLNGGEAPPSLENPTVSTVSSNSQINLTAVVDSN